MIHSMTHFKRTVISYPSTISIVAIVDVDVRSTTSKKTQTLHPHNKMVISANNSNGLLLFEYGLKVPVRFDDLRHN